MRGRKIMQVAFLRQAQDKPELSQALALSDPERSEGESKGAAEQENFISRGNNVLTFFLFLLLFLFSFYLMFYTFGYDAKRSTMLIAPKLWSDFGAHIPLIRSFSMGDNWPPASPLYPGEPIRYHFGF